MVFLMMRIVFVFMNCEIKKNDLLMWIVEVCCLIFLFLFGIFLILWVFKLIYDCIKYKMILDYVVISEWL